MKIITAFMISIIGFSSAFADTTSTTTTTDPTTATVIQNQDLKVRARKGKPNSKNATPTIDVNKTDNKKGSNPNIPDGSSAIPDGTTTGIGTSPTLTPNPH